MRDFDMEGRLRYRMLVSTIAMALKRAGKRGSEVEPETQYDDPICSVCHPMPQE